MFCVFYQSSPNCSGSTIAILRDIFSDSAVLFVSPDYLFWFVSYFSTNGSVYKPVATLALWNGRLNGVDFIANVETHKRHYYNKVKKAVMRHSVIINGKYSAQDHCSDWVITFPSQLISKTSSMSGHCQSQILKYVSHQHQAPNLMTLPCSIDTLRG